MEKKQDREGLGLAAGASGCVYVWVGCVFRGERLEDIRQRAVTHQTVKHVNLSRQKLHFTLMLVVKYCTSC